jgi:hypothetical protein
MLCRPFYDCRPILIHEKRTIFVSAISCDGKALHSIVSHRWGAMLLLTRFLGTESLVIRIPLNPADSNHSKESNPIESYLSVEDKFTYDVY